jgi:hypothetical protein
MGEDGMLDGVSTKADTMLLAEGQLAGVDCRRP